jgi:hypothetical protein
VPPIDEAAAQLRPQPRSPQEHYAIADAMLREIEGMADDSHEIYELPERAQLPAMQIMVATAQVHATLATIR